MAKAKPEPTVIQTTASGPWTDLGLTLPVFVGYHLGVVFLPVRNAADWMTRRLSTLADNDPQLYATLTICVGIAYTGTLIALGRGHALRGAAFAWLLAEAVVYATAMRYLASFVVGKVFLGPHVETDGFAGLVLSLGAGLYEELAFRVVLFGFGFWLLKLLFSLNAVSKAMVGMAWALTTAVIFSLWHYVGVLGDPFEPRSFVFRTTCGLVFCAIYYFRGFAPVVWTHVLYDVWVLVL